MALIYVIYGFIYFLVRFFGLSRFFLVSLVNVLSGAWGAVLCAVSLVAHLGRVLCAVNQSKRHWGNSTQRAPDPRSTKTQHKCFPLYFSTQTKNGTQRPTQRFNPNFFLIRDVRANNTFIFIFRKMWILSTSRIKYGIYFRVIRAKIKKYFKN